MNKILEGKAKKTDIKYRVLNQKLGDDLLSHGEAPHYHRRCTVSLLSSVWNQVVPALYVRQANWLVIGINLLPKSINQKSLHTLHSTVNSHKGSAIKTLSLWSSLTSNQYWLAQRLTTLTHPAYQRLGLKRLFRGLKAPGRSYLGRGFKLRCFQRLSRPNVATGQCHWHDNPNTRGSSIPVLSYQEQLSSNLQRPRQIGTELSHDVLNPARVPL